MTFTDEIAKKLDYYVYRLIDPRNGETFYVGKGKDNRVFEHAADRLKDSADAVSERLQRIREIRSAGFEVAHVIHRHGLDQRTAYEVEAALIDAYPGLTNLVGGQDSNDRGTMHADEIIRRYKAPVAEFKHDVVIININKSALERSIYEAVRYSWVIDRKRAEKAEYVLATRRGLIIGAFKANWLPATPEHFPGRPDYDSRRSGFVGCEAPKAIKDFYIGKRLPEALLKRGAANPIRYVWRDSVAPAMASGPLYR